MLKKKNTQNKYRITTDKRLIPSPFQSKSNIETKYILNF